jgi:hypothetical protein
MIVPGAKKALVITKTQPGSHRTRPIPGPSSGAYTYGAERGASSGPVGSRVGGFFST